MNPSRYRPAGAPPDYGHRFHAGNVGDVWKHVALVAVLDAVAGADAPVQYLDTHAGEGRYALGATGEWTEGVGRLWGAPSVGDPVVGRYVALTRVLGGDRGYPGSPLLARAVLGPAAALALWERDPDAGARLATALGADPHARVHAADGLADLPAAVRDAEAAGGPVAVLVDPPWSAKADWTAIPGAVMRAVDASARATVLLWYPVKSLTRPNAMLAAFAAAGVPGAAAALVTTPLTHQRRRLNGSGVVVLRPPPGALARLAGAAPEIGAACATQRGAWSLRLQAWE